MWEAQCGEDFSFVRPFLRATEMVGSRYPCPNRFGECPRKIVDYGNGEFAALCRDPYKSCRPIPLGTREALLHDLDLAGFLQPILQAASIRAEAPKPRGSGVWSLGLSGRRSSQHQPVFLVIAHSASDFESAVCDLLLEVPGQFVMLVPTNRYRSVETQERIQARGIQYLCLGDLMFVDEEGRFAVADSEESVEVATATPALDRKRVVKEFRRRYNCKVADIQRAAGVYETDYYGWLYGKAPDHYAHCIRIERVLRRGLPKPDHHNFS